jgi:hypothetical protein
LIPADRLSLSQQERLRQGAENNVKARLARKLATTPNSLVVRDADYVADFVPAATAAGLAGWLSMPLAAIAGVYSVFADNVPAAQAPQVPNNQAWIFYGAAILLADAAGETITQLRFSVGAAANRRAQFDLENLYSGWTAMGYFSQPVVYDPQEIATVQIVARIPTAAGARIQLLTFVAEPLQQNVI